jgi:hypothetical protein
MCTSSPSITRPDEPQESKTPDSANEAKRRRDNAQRGAMAGGTWLTGVSGVPTQSTNVGATTLLGG